MYEKQKTIPTYVGLLLAIVLVVVVVVFFEGSTRTFTKATGNVKPASVEVTNIADTSFTVTWVTDTESTGAVNVINNVLLSQTLLDDRDTDGKMKKYITHAVTIRNLKPSTRYSWKILANGKEYGQSETAGFQTTTAPSLPAPSDILEPAYGSVTTDVGQPADGAIVYLTVVGGQKLSTLVKPSGSWVMPLNLSRTENLTSYLTVAERMTENIVVKNGSIESTAITDTLNDSPVPTMVLGKSYDFRKQQAKKPIEDFDLMTPTPTKPSLPIAFIPPKSNKKGASDVPTKSKILGTSDVLKSSLQNDVMITNPKNGAHLSTFTPLFQGTGVSGKTVTITIGIKNPISGTTTVDDDGLWRFTPSKALAPGEQSVTITSVDVKDKPVAVTHMFEILKSGTQVLGDATPSATLAPTATPTIEASTTAEPIPETATTLPTMLITLLGIALIFVSIVVIL